LRGQAARLRGDPESGLDHVERSTATFERMETPTYLAEALVEEARVRAALGDEDGARRARSRAVEQYEHVGDTTRPARLHAEHQDGP
jgi:hypothetical protein